MPVSGFGQGRPSALDELASQLEGYREKPVANAEGLCHDRRHAEIRESAWKYSRKRWRNYADELGDKASSADLTALDQKLSGLIENIRKSAIDQATLEKAVKDLNARDH